MSNMTNIEKLQALRAMGKNGFLKINNALARRIAELALEVRDAVYSKVRQEEFEDARQHQMEIVNHTYRQLAKYQPHEFETFEAVHPNREFDPIYPVKILGFAPATERGESGYCHEISWPVWWEVRDRLTEEEAAIFALIQFKDKMIEARESYKWAMRYFASCQIEDPNTFEVFPSEP